MAKGHSGEWAILAFSAATVVIRGFNNSMGQVLARAKRNAELPRVDMLLHDMAFDMTEVLYDQTHAIVEVGLYSSARVHDLAMPRRIRGTSANGNKSEMWLKISRVNSYELRDPEGIVIHSYARLQLLEDHRLLLQSNFPGSIEFEVSELDIEVCGIE